MRKQSELFFPVLLACMMYVSSAAGDTIANPATFGLSDLENGLGNLPPAQLSGWFSNASPFYSDPAQPWTSAANIATLDYWASLVARFGENPELLSQLYGLGMTDPLLISQTSAVPQASSQQTPAVVPEPGTLGILGFALGILGIFVGTRRTGVCRPARVGIGPVNSNVTIRSPD
jgi:hypothetical protein